MKNRKLFISILTGLCACLMSATLLTACKDDHTHSYTEQTVNATCTEKGVTIYTCDCGNVYTEEIPAIGHNEKTHEAKAPTCTEIGWNEYVTCERDGCDYSTYEELPVLKHDEETHEAKAPTCTEIGWNEYVTCEREGCGYSTYEELPATGIHTWDNGTETQTPTCTKEGEMTYLCTVCKKITKTEPIETLPHEHAKEWSYNETHHYHECKCGDKADETKHSPSAPATATTKQTCTICGYIIQEETGILFNTFSVNDTKVYGKVSNATTEFSFINEVLIKGNATYVVDNDKDCNSPIASKTVDLNVGDNVFYVLESAGNNVKLYTVTIRRRPMYDVTFNTNGGTAVEKQIVEEDSFAVEPEVSKQGYTLAGWNYDFTLPITKNTHITAIWDANNGTKYTVNYYLQNIDDDNYALYETDELKGITNTDIEAVIKDYQHFTYNEAKSTVEGIVKPDGSLVLSVYYTRNSYTIQVGTEIVNVGSEITQTGGVRYGVEVTCTTSLTDGYTFLGWYDSVNLVSTDIEFVFIAEKDVIYMAKWQANDDTKYIVNYYCQNIENDEYTLYDTKEFTGTTDTTAAATVYEYDHFTYNESISTVSGNIHGDGSLVLSVYYTRNKYTVQAGYYLENVSSSIMQIETWKYGSECTASVTLIDGYTWLGWYEYEGSELRFVNANLSFIFIVEKDVTYYQCWKLSENTKYTVNYYLQNLENNEYTLYETDELTGTTDTLATAEIKEYPHFTYNESVSTISDYIKGDGSLLLSVYYTRDIYTVTTNGNNAKAGTYKQINGNYRYDKEITLTATTNTGYTFLGWYEGEVLACCTTEFTFKAEKNVTYTAKWQANDNTKYTVKYYLQNLDNNEYTLKETANLTGTTDSVVMATIKEYDHYIHNANISVISGNVKGDNSLVLSVYYTRATYDIVVNGNSAKAGTYTQINGNYRYGKELTLTATTNAGYTWLGWYEGETRVSETENFTVKVEKDVTYTAKWQANTTTKYKVNYYLQNVDSDTYTLRESVDLTGTTDTLATAEIKTYTHFVYNASKSTTSGNINGNGGQILKVYYTRANYTVTANRNNTKAGTITGGGSYSYDKQITLTATTNAGYTFLGWYDGENRICETASFTLNVQKNVTYTAKWQANNNTKYTVNYYLQNVDNNEYTLYESNELKGETNTIATATVKEYEHFTYKASASVISGTINGDGSLVLNVYYTRDTYTISTEINNVKAGTVNQGGTYRFDKQITLTATTKAGYTFLGWHEGDVCVCATETFVFGVEKTATYTAKWQANEDTVYTVKYYRQNIDNDNYTVYETIELSGATDTNATAEVKTYQHFTYNANKSTVSGNINGDESLVLSVYYTRNSYTISAIADNTQAGTISGAGAHLYDQQITLIATTNAGYTFNGWYEGENPINQTAELTFNVEKDVTYTAKWTANTDTKYTINYYLQNLENDEYALQETVELTGTTDTNATAEIKEYMYFTYNASKSTISGNINGDGSGALNVYYTRNTYTLSINDSSIGSITNAGTYRYGKAITTTATPYFGYEFIGWYSGEELLSTDLTYTFTVTQNITAKFEVKAEISNFNFTSSATTCSITGIHDKTVMEIVVPDYVTSISEGAFSGCSSLESITLPFAGAKAGVTENDTYQYPFGYIFGTNSYIGGTATTQSYYGSSTSRTTSTTYYIPSLLQAVTITKGNILYRAFSSCGGLTRVTIGNSVTSIGDYAFYDCYRLVEVVNKSIHITVSKDSTSNGFVGYYALAVYNSGDMFERTKLSNDNGYVVYTDGDEKILVGYNGTENDLILPSYIAKINQYAFYYCYGMTSITISNSVTSIGDSAFYYCYGMTSITIPDSVTSIGNSAFYNCYGMTSITIGNSVTSIGNYAFCYCDSLTSISIPDSVTSIGDYAFYDCYNLTSITFEDTSTWYRTDSYWNYIDKTGGSQTNVAGATANATYFKSTYIDYYWYKL